MDISFTRPAWLILIPFVIAGLIYSGKFLRIQNKAKKIKYIVLRILVMVLLVFALAGIGVKWGTDETTTIFLVDLSDSTKESQDEMEAYLKNVLSDMPKNNQAGIVAFGENTVVEQFVSSQKLFTEFGKDTVATATNVEKAVSAALALFPEDTGKRIVILTDGNENEGSVSNMASALIAEGVQVDVIFVDSFSGEEVYVSDLSIPDAIHVGDNFSVTVTVNSNVTTGATVSLYSGRTLKGIEEVVLQPGENQFVFTDVGDEGGLKTYRVVVEAENDGISVNNEYCAFTQVDAKPRVLVVEGQAGLGDEYAKILDAAGILYDKVTPTGVPETIAELNNYKCVILLDVYYDDLRESFVNCLDTYVKDYAGGFICIGGENSYALGGYRDTVLEDILPVYMDLQGEKEVPKMAIAMVIDHSGSMTTVANDGTNTTGLDLAKMAAVEGLDSLRATDEVGVLAFDDTYTWVVPIQQANDTEEITEAISTIGYGGGTSIYPALQQAAQELIKSDAQIKHIILLTDGQDYYNQYESVINTINDNGITLSTVAVGEDADVRMLSNLAEFCDGRYYYTDVDSGIPRIFAKEIFLSVKSYLINEEFTPVVVINHEIIKGVLDNGYPSLLGYVAASPKETATRILESHLGDPILTTWQYGLGKTVAWNSDGTNQWTGNWAGFDGYVSLWKNIIDYTISNTELGDDQLTITQSGSGAVISYIPAEYDANTKITAVCTDENGEVKELSFDPVAPGEYESSIDLDNLGVYSLSIRNENGDEVIKNMNTATALQYSNEYRMDYNSDSVKNFVTMVNGNILTMEDDVFRGQVEHVKARIGLTFPFLLLALLLFMLDLITRRLNLSYLEGTVEKLQARKARKQELAMEKEAAQYRESLKKPSNGGMQQESKKTEGINQAAQTNSGKAGKPEKKKTNSNKQAKKPEKEKPHALDTSELLRKKQDRDF